MAESRDLPRQYSALIGVVSGQRAGRSRSPGAGFVDPGQVVLVLGVQDSPGR